jgi:hypothetical protein
MNKGFSLLKSKIQSNDWKEILKASDSLAKIGGDDVLSFLISLLNSENQLHRDGAALALKEIGDDRAVKFLFNSIFKFSNRNGTMVYALTSLNCEHHLVDLYRIQFKEAYEAKMSVIQILEEQIFTFTDLDLLKVKDMWAFCNRNPETCKEFEIKAVKEQMERCIEWYMSYLEE